MIPFWQKEFIKSISYAKFLADRKDETSLRQGFVLLDNSVEQFIRDVINSSKTKKDEFFNFHKLVDILKENHSISDNIISEISEFHRTRNILYHKSTYLSISLEKFNGYVQLVETLCDELSLDNLSVEIQKQVKIIHDEMKNEIEEKKDRKRSICINMLTDSVIRNFELVSNEFVGDFMLASPIGYSVAADNMIFIADNFLKSKKNKLRILELIESNTENAYHSYFLSLGDNKIWFCYINSIWSKYGDGEDYYCKRIKQFINNNEERIIYKQDSISKNLLEDYFSCSTV